jgi:hypothetical protein
MPDASSPVGITGWWMRFAAIVGCPAATLIAAPEPLPGWVPEMSLPEIIGVAEPPPVRIPSEKSLNELPETVGVPALKRLNPRCVSVVNGVGSLKTFPVTIDAPAAGSS